MKAKDLEKYRWFRFYKVIFSIISVVLFVCVIINYFKSNAKEVIISPNTPWYNSVTGEIHCNRVTGGDTASFVRNLEDYKKCLELGKGDSKTTTQGQLDYYNGREPKIIGLLVVTEIILLLILFVLYNFIFRLITYILYGKKAIE